MASEYGLMSELLFCRIYYPMDSIFWNAWQAISTIQVLCYAWLLMIYSMNGMVSSQRSCLSWCYVLDTCQMRVRQHRQACLIVFLVQLCLLYDVCDVCQCYVFVLPPLPPASMMALICPSTPLSNMSSMPTFCAILPNSIIAKHNNTSCSTPTNSSINLTLPSTPFSTNTCVILSLSSYSLSSQYDMDISRRRHSLIIYGLSMLLSRVRMRMCMKCQFYVMCSICLVYGMKQMLQNFSQCSCKEGEGYGYQVGSGMYWLGCLSYKHFDIDQDSSYQYLSCIYILLLLLLLWRLPLT